jgi:DNA polymerase-3 subunit gamma/tau
MTWYRTHRPRTISGLHLTQVRSTLQALMKQGRLPQVMLFAGPKGTGKTSTARIIGALLNDPANEATVRQLFLAKAKTKGKAPALAEPSASELADKIFNGTSYLVQEMDAASNRGIDDVRSLKERVNMPPQDGLISVYILDEAHMLTTEAFNALLKLLEEPPAHAVFILATTELHKIPPTIVSRSTLIQFTKATPVELAAALTQVLKAENITFEQSAVESIAEYADGSFRDGVKTLELLAAGSSQLTLEMVEAHLTGSYHHQLEKVIQLVLAKDAVGVVKLFQELRQHNVDQDFFFKQLCTYIHTSLLQALGAAPGTSPMNQTVAHFLLSELQTVSMSSVTSIPFLPLELKILELIFRSKAKPSAAVAVPATAPTPAPPAEKKSLELPLTLTQPAETVVSAQPVTAAAMNMVSDNLLPVEAGDSAKLLEQWEKFIELVGDKNSSVAALLRSAKPLSSEKGKATIAVFYKFHKEQLQQPKFKKMIEECSQPMTGGPVTFEFVLAETPPAVAAEETKDMSSLAEELLM